MKKLLIIAAVILLLLCGCGEEPMETTPSTTEPVETVDPGLYLPESEAEIHSGGSVRAYLLTGNAYWDMDILGERLLLFSGEETTTVETLTGELCQRGSKTELPLDLRKAGYAVVNNGIAYYDAAKTAVYLDGQLQSYHTVKLPEEMEGKPIFALDGTEIFYCVGQELRGMDTQREVSRLIKSQSCTAQTLEAGSFGGKVVKCLVTLEDGSEEIRYISTENGGTLRTDAGITAMETHETWFLATRMDGTTKQYIYGAEGQSAQLLHAPEARVEGALELGGVVGVDVTEENLSLSFYDLTTAKKTAAVTIPGGKTPVAVSADSRTGCIWVLTDGNTLYRWQKDGNPVTEETVYSGTVFSHEAPDAEGLKALQTRVDSLNKKHGTAIRIWNDAVKTTGGHTLEPEYQTAAITKALDALEAVLDKFPENYLYKSVNTKLRICIVRSVDGNIEALRFLDDGDTFILLSCGVDTEKEFLSAIGYVVDIHTLGNSPMLDDWSKLNPEGFAYGEGNDVALAEGENRSFADKESMTAVSEERARLFYYAMLPEGAALFKSPVMQQKLLLMCQAIRDAWRLERKTETYLWEQYLTESIAYQK